MGNRHAIIDEQGLRSSQDFTDRVIRDKQHKVYVSEHRTITNLYDLKNDPLEKNNLVNSKGAEHLAALEKFYDIIRNEMPEVDNRLPYTKRAPNPWDISIEKVLARDALKKSKKTKNSKKPEQKPEMKAKDPNKIKRRIR